MTKSIATLCAATFLLQPIAAIAADTTSYTYDEARPGSFNAGQLTTVSNAAATIRYDHDERGNVTSQRWEVDGTTYTQTFTYAPHDQVLRRTFADGDTIPSASGTYQYDGAGLLKSIPGLITNISYNANFDPVSTSYGNGVTETRTYDPNRQWLMSITASTGSSTLFEESYIRSTKGLITDVASNRANGDWQYGYDTADRLTSATNLNSSDYTQTFQYDAADNMTNNSSVGSYTYPAPTALRPHAVTQAGSHIYSYDSNGNMTSGAGRTIDYDGENRPRSITYNGQTTTFLYGPDGARLKKVTGGNTTLYLGADEEITSDGTHIKHPLADVRKSGTDISWMHRDHLSSVKLMSDTVGAVIAENFYRPYGERSDEQSPLSVPRESKGWIGERDDKETGLTFLNARYYDPVLARFVSPDWFDPKNSSVGTNRYAYGLNNPVLFKDPSGNLAQTAAASGGWLGGALSSIFGGLGAAGAATIGAVAGIFLAGSTTSVADATMIGNGGSIYAASTGGSYSDSIFANESSNNNGDNSRQNGAPGSMAAAGSPDPDDEDPLDHNRWGKPDHGAGKSWPKYGHARSQHGSQRKAQALKDRATNINDPKPQGHFSDNRMIEEAFSLAPRTPGAHSVIVSRPSFVYTPQGETLITRHVMVVIHPVRGPRTAYPYIP